MKLLICLLFMLTSCLQDNLSPESALQSFVEARMGKIVNREDILERVTGKMKQSLENITEEEFTQFADLKNVRKDSFKVISKSCQEKKCYLTYSISYKTKDDLGEKTTFSSEVKKIAEIVNENGKWLIADVTNIKTYHESMEPLNP